MPPSSEAAPPTSVTYPGRTGALDTDSEFRGPPANPERASGTAHVDFAGRRAVSSQVSPPKRTLRETSTIPTHRAHTERQPMSDEKTEEPTDKKLRDARRDGEATMLGACRFGWKSLA